MKKTTIVIFLLLSASKLLLATIINVPGDQQTIQLGLNTAVEGDTVLVGTDTYYENITWPTTNGIKLIGSGEENCVIDGSQQASVIRFEEDLSGIIDTTTLITGFTIQNGLEQGGYDYTRGGGIYCYSSSPYLLNVTITDNSVQFGGGGIFLKENSNPILENVMITNNSAYDSYSSGGGICCMSNSNPILENVMISNNSAYYGGGIYCRDHSSPSLENVTITNNSADSSGGGIYCRDLSSPGLVDVTISNNSANYGGGIFCRNNSTPSLGNVTINNNTSDYGGGINCDSSSPNLVNVKITNNHADYSGGGIYCGDNSNPKLVGLTISDNTAGWYGGGIHSSESSPSLVNTILWNDTPQEIHFSGSSDPSSIMIAYSDIQGGATGIVTNDNGIVYWEQGNIDADPLFLDTQNEYYILQAASPCIDAGTDYFEWENEVLVDLSDDEYIGPAPDMGAIECDGVINVPEELPTIQAGLNAAINGDTVQVATGTYYENITWPPTNNIKLIGSGEEDCIIDGSQQERVILFDEDLGGIIDTTTLITGFKITNGSAYNGGGISFYESSPSLRNVTITNNSSDYGGGISCSNNSSPNLENVNLTNNSASYGGGVYCLDNSSPSLVNVNITYNSTSFGGGIYCRDNSSPSLVDVTISSNMASDDGGSIYCWNSSPNLENVTITNNSAQYNGGGIYCRNNSTPSLVNSIMWNNSPHEILFSEYNNPNSILIAYSDIQSGGAGIVTNSNGTVYWEAGNMDSDPLFMDEQNGDYTLQAISPCVDSGTDFFEWENEVLVDLSDDEYIGPAPDMGAFEYSDTGLMDDNCGDIPATHTLLQNYPNPFNPITTITFSITANSKVDLTIFNIKGQKVKTLAHSFFKKGKHSVVWNGTDDTGKYVSSGVYFYCLDVDGLSKKSRKCILMK